MDSMDKLLVLTACDDGSCCCLPPRSAIAIISVISLVACLLDMVSMDDGGSSTCSSVKEYVDSIRSLLVTLFQMANLLLLLASIVESAILVQIYIWYTLAFVVMGLMVSILELLFKVKCEGMWSFVTFLPEVVFLFVIFRCMPIVDAYRKRIDVKS